MLRMKTSAAESILVGKHDGRVSGHNMCKASQQTNAVAAAAATAAAAFVALRPFTGCPLLHAA